MTLLRQIQAAFPKERVVHLGRPGWLAPQTPDIYPLDRNIGIEYQGAQHSTPVEYFGGAKAFELQLERDARSQLSAMATAANSSRCTPAITLDG
jgi:hypothetical protein